MVIFNFIGNFTLVLLDFPLLSDTGPSLYSGFSGFIFLLCHPYLPATFSGLRPSLFSFDPSLCYSTVWWVRKLIEFFINFLFLKIFVFKIIGSLFNLFIVRESLTLQHRWLLLTTEDFSVLFLLKMLITYFGNYLTLFLPNHNL
jgi:hypothetical protein